MNRELRDISISALVLAFVFAFANTRTFDIIEFGNLMILSLLSVCIAFIFHELGHRQIARYFDCHAEYRLWKKGIKIALILVLATKLIGIPFIFAALGAVVIYPRADLWGNVKPLSRKENGLISISGPLINVTLAIILLVINYSMNFTGFLLQLVNFSIQINLWLAFFNLLPIPPLDGFKVFLWSKTNWILTILVIFFLQGLI